MERNVLRRRRRTVLTATLLVPLVATGIGCGGHASVRSPVAEPAASPTVAVPPPAAPVDEELVGPPMPDHLGSEEEIVGPPAPSAGTESAASEPAPRPDVSEPVVIAAAPAPAPVTSRSERLIGQLERKGISAAESTRGVVIVLPESVFEFGTSELPKESKRRIHDIADAIVAEANRSIVSVEGHTDSTGADLYNRGLSERRAKAVAQELALAGVGDKRVRSVGYGAMYPIAPNQHADGSDDPIGRARNRRVEIVIESAMAQAH